jgi:Ser/Thr protein kinase RdoA (MazF antagonist)
MTPHHRKPHGRDPAGRSVDLSLAAPMFRPPDWDWTSSGDIGWWVRPDWRSALLGSKGLKLEEWRSGGRLSTVKEGPQRVVYRADLPEGGVFIKHFLVPGWREMFRQWFRRGKGRNEAKRAAKLAAIGVPTIVPIALGEQRRRNFLFENYLITAAIPETVPLDEFVQDILPGFLEPRRTRIRQELSVALAELTARLHDAGFLHTDFHPGNLLVRLDDGDHPRLAMIDLDALRLRRRIGWREAQANLALLNHYFWLRSGRTDRQRFVTAYVRARRVAPPDPHGFARGIEVATRAWAERLWRRWGRRCQSTNKYFKTFWCKGAWGVAARALDRDIMRTLLDDPDGPFSWPNTVLLKDSRTTTVAEVTLPVRGGGIRVIYKRFNRKKWLDPFLCVFRPSRAWRAWQAGQDLASRAVATPRNLAVIGRLDGGPKAFRLDWLPRDTYLVTVKAQPSITLGDYARDVMPTLDPVDCRAQLRRLIPALARLVRTLHERSLSHRDLKAANILIEGDPAAAEPRLSLIDLVGVQLRFPTPNDRIVQNLARLQISLGNVSGRTRTDALRFLHAYVPRAFARREDWKDLWRAVEARCHRKEEQNRRRGRALT